MLPPAIHAGHALPDGDRARATAKRRLPSFSIEVEDLIDGPADREAVLLPEAAGRPHAGDRVPPHDGAARAPPAVGVAAVDEVPVRARSSESRDVAGRRSS